MKAKFILLSILLSLVFTSYSQTTSNKENPQSKTQDVLKAPEKIMQLSGTVIDSTTEKIIPMAFVMVAGTNIGTITDQEGNFVIQAPEGAKQLAFSAKGYKVKKADIDAKKAMKIKLEPKDK